MMKLIIGVIYGFTSGFLFTLNNILIKAYDLNFVDIVFVRSVSQAATFATVLMITGQSFLPSHNLRNEPVIWKAKCLSQLQGIFGSVVRLTSLGAVLLLPVGDALTLIFAGPLFTMILGRVFLKIPITLWKLLFGLLSICGVIILVRPDFIFQQCLPELKPQMNATVSEISLSPPGSQMSSFLASYVSEKKLSYLGVGLALSSAFFASLNSVTLAYLKDLSPYLLVFYCGVWNGLIISFIAPFDQNSKIFSSLISQMCLHTWAMLFGIAFLGIIGYVAVVKALHLIDPTIVTVLATLEIVFGYIGQVIFMHEQPNMMSLIGAGLVLISVVAISCEDFVKPACLSVRPRWSNNNRQLILNDSLEADVVSV